MNLEIEIWKDVAKGLVGILVAVFLPKQLFLFLREFISFCFKAALKYWVLNILMLGTAFAAYFWFPYQLNEDMYFSITISIILLTSVLIRLAKLYRKLALENALVVYGCFSTRDGDYLIVDIDAESINDFLQEKCDDLNATNFVFREQIIRIQFIEFPKFIPLLFGYKGVKKIFERFIRRNKHIASLYFIRKIGDQQLTPSFNFNADNFSNAELLKYVQVLLNVISSERKLGVKTVTDIAVKLYSLIFGQSFLDLIILNKKYSDVQTILDDSQRLLNQLTELFKANHVELPDEIQFIKIWKSYIDRYRAILLLEQKELRGAASYLISSISLNPYYPYFSYDSFKDNYTKRYGIELSYSIQDVSNDLELNDERDFDGVRKKISDNIISNEAQFGYMLLLEIIHKDENGVTYKYIEEELLKLATDNLAIMLVAAEVIKYLPDGSEKINEIYSGRIDVIVELLEKIIQKDSSFSVIHSKIGALLLNKAFLNGTEEEISFAMERWMLGMHFLTELGFHVHNPSK